MLHISSNTAPQKIASGVICNAKQQRETHAYQQTLHIQNSAGWTSGKNEFYCVKSSKVDGIEVESDITAPPVCVVPLLPVYSHGRLRVPVNVCESTLPPCPCQ